jgi:hypothetical protein
MKKKTVLLVALCVALALSFTLMSTACDNKKETPAAEEPATETPAEETPATEPSADDSAADTATTDAAAVGGVPNPVVEATPDEVKDKFGVEFQAPDEYSEGATYSLVGDDVGQMEYTMDTGKGPVKVTYRVSKTLSMADLSGTFDEFSKMESVKLEGGQDAIVSTKDSTGPGVVFWTNKSVVSGPINASVVMDPVEQASELTDVANFFAGQESKGF